MKYRFVKKVVTNRHNSEYVIYYTEGLTGFKWEKIKTSQTGCLATSERHYLDLVNPPTVTIEVLATEEVK